jgi:phosphate transport system substrate-binding protein
MKLLPTSRLGRLALVLGSAAVLSMAVACGGGGDDEGDSAKATQPPAPTATPSNLVAGYPKCATGGAKDLTGAGATFPFPLYSKFIDEYGKLCEVKINYQSIGSGGGIKAITEKTVDFGASDGILTEAQETAAKAAGGDIMHIAMTSGSEAIIFNLPGIDSGKLKLDGATLANIFLGNIKKWNDPAIAALNAGVTLPNADIAVVHRSDGSGTTFIFTNYLSKVSPEWQTKVGFATSVNWPAGVGAQGNEGVAGQVKQLPGAIGYVELAYAKQNKLAWAQMKNKAGTYLEPSIEGTSAASAGITIPPDMKILITDSENPKAYPIAGFTWILAYVNQPDAAKGKAVAHYLWWAIHDGQQFATALDYGALSTDAVKVAEAQIQKLMCGAAPCLAKQ